MELKINGDGLEVSIDSVPDAAYVDHVLGLKCDKDAVLLYRDLGVARLMTKPRPDFLVAVKVEIKRGDDGPRFTATGTTNLGNTLFGGGATGNEAIGNMIGGQSADSVLGIKFHWPCNADYDRVR